MILFGRWVFMGRSSLDEDADVKERVRNTSFDSDWGLQLRRLDHIVLQLEWEILEYEDTNIISNKLQVSLGRILLNCKSGLRILMNLKVIIYLDDWCMIGYTIDDFCKNCATPSFFTQWNK